MVICASISVGVLLAFVTPSFAVPSADIICGACTLAVTELEVSIAGAGKKKHARSELELSDALETICDRSIEWTGVIHPTTGKGVYARRPTLRLKQIPDQPTMYQLGDACSDFLDNYEDQLIKFASRKHENPVRQFCHETLKLCTAVDVTPLPEGSEEKQDDEKGGFSNAEEGLNEQKKEKIGDEL